MQNAYICQCFLRFLLAVINPQYDQFVGVSNEQRPLTQVKA
jgi:hypothetical protein